MKSRPGGFPTYEGFRGCKGYTCITFILARFAAQFVCSLRARKSRFFLVSYEFQFALPPLCRKCLVSEAGR